jgi:hypothetical protein
MNNTTNGTAEAHRVSFSFQQFRTERGNERRTLMNTGSATGGGAGTLLQVKAAMAAADPQHVHLVLALAEAPRALRLRACNTKPHGQHSQI